MCFSSFFVDEVNAWFGVDKPLLQINEKVFTQDDFRQWWLNYKDNNSVFPSDLSDFIEWHLLVEEAKRLELDSLPSYRKKLETFLRVRGMFLLKNEEIDSKIIISEDEILFYYNKKYNPIWRVIIYTFENELLANEAFIEIQKNGLINFAQPINAERFKFVKEEKKYIPISFNDNDLLLSVLTKLKSGEFSSPQPYNNKFIIMNVVSIENRSDDSIKSHHDKIFDEIRKRKQSNLTNILIDKLKIKYNVKINRDLFAVADQDNLSQADLNTPFINTINGDFLFNTFVKKIREDVNFTKKLNTISQEKKEEMKEWILNGMLFDILIAWEIIDRHYENNPPLKDLYIFYQENRLISEFNKEVFEKNILLSDADLLNYYNNHLQDFSNPVSVTIATLKTEPDLAEKIRIELSQGNDFFDVVKKYQPGELPIQQRAENELEPEIRAVVENLSNGEVRGPFLVNKQNVFLKLINRKSSPPKPFATVSSQISDKIIKQKIKDLRNDYLAKLKAKTTISINQNLWETLRKEYGAADDRKGN